ncbi:MAG: trypsin-like peptidase domain-containing protein [Burkholderiales bacterium]
MNIFTSKEARMQSHPFMDDPLFRRFFGEESRNEQRKESSLGSGVIVSTDGYILTNHHVVEQVEIALADGRRARARIVGADPENRPRRAQGRHQRRAQHRPCCRGVRVGDVAAIGNCSWRRADRHHGHRERAWPHASGDQHLRELHPDRCRHQPRNSGGALIDASGNLIGINTAIYSRTGGSQGIGFAIPESVAKQVLQQIVANGCAVTRGWIGVEAQDLSKELADSFGLAHRAAR